MPIANVSKRLGHRDAYTTAKIYQHALPDTDQDVAATWDKLMAEKAEKKPVAQIGTTSGRRVGRKTLMANASVWRPQGDSNPRYRRERAMS